MMHMQGLLRCRLRNSSDSMYFSSSEGRFPLALEEPPDTALKGASSSSLSEMSNQIDLFGFGGPADVFFFKTAAFLACLVLDQNGVDRSAGAPSRERGRLRLIIEGACRRTFREQGSVEGRINTLDPSSPFLWPPVMMASEPTASGSSAAAMASVKTG